MPPGRPRGSSIKGITHRYQLILPIAEFEAIRAFARSTCTTIRAAIERFIRLGLVLHKASRAGHPIIIRKEGENDREIILL